MMMMAVMKLKKALPSRKRMFLFITILQKRGTTILHGRMMRQIYVVMSVSVTMIWTMFTFKCIQVNLF